MMLIHLTLPVRQLSPAIRFYDAVLGVLDARRVFSSSHAVAYAPSGDDQAFLWLVPSHVRPGASGCRLALAAPDSALIRLFHDTAMAHDAVSLTAPAFLPHFGPSAFGCVVQDADGHQLEVIAGHGAAEQRPLNESADDAWDQEGFEHYNP